MQSHCSSEMPIVSNTLSFTNLIGSFSSFLSLLTRPLLNGALKCRQDLPQWQPRGHSEILVGSIASFLGSSSSPLLWLLSLDSPPCSFWKEQITISYSQLSACKLLQDGTRHFWPRCIVTVQMWMMLQGSPPLQIVFVKEEKYRCATALPQGADMQLLLWKSKLSYLTLHGNGLGELNMVCYYNTAVRQIAPAE